MFNSPTQMGIDSIGNLFVYDSGNKYMRLIQPDGIVYTLLNGACRQDIRFSPIFYQTLQIRKLICLKNWIKLSGEPSEHILTQDDDMTICSNHFTLC